MPKLRHSYQVAMIFGDKIPLGKRHALNPCKCTRVLSLSLYDPSISCVFSTCSTSHKILSKRLPSPEVGATETPIAQLQDLRFGISVCCHHGFPKLTTSNRCTYTKKMVYRPYISTHHCVHDVRVRFHDQRHHHHLQCHEHSVQPYSSRNPAVISYEGDYGSYLTEVEG